MRISDWSSDVCSSDLCDHGGNSDREYGWFDFRSMVGKEGWSGATLRFFERVSQPRVEFSRDSFGRSYPVEQSWDNLPLRRLIDAKVRVLDRHNEKLDIPDEQLRSEEHTSELQSLMRISY